MLKKIKIINFRSIENMDLYFEKSNNIIWKNWAWKTNILQAICHLFLNNNSSFSTDDILKIWQENIYIEWIFAEENFENKLTFSYDKNLDKKIITLNWKKVTKKVLYENILKISYFSPTEMNLFYLWPKNRRDFLDNILKNIFIDYEKLLKDYEKVVKNRNKVLKNIFEEKSKKEEIIFWNEEFIKLAKKIYGYRIPLNNFLEENIKSKTNIFQNKVKNIAYKYITKVDLENIENCIRDYLEKNLQRDIILARTHIWPHIDDFDIIVDERNLLNFASRWEIKSIIISLKLSEINYLKKITWKTPILLIDDLASELDKEHSNLILNELENLQIIYTSILALDKKETNKILI